MLLHSAQRLYDASTFCRAEPRPSPTGAACRYGLQYHDTPAKFLTARADRHATALGLCHGAGDGGPQQGAAAHHFPEHYADLIPEPTESYLAEARRHLAHLPGAYELKMSLELPA